ncbi:sugar porter family MFS transporter [Aspergillus stella-maris]|uniref:sugar porter family MFS transporter n=1 Tax=Aspergillus stella-maris TaxID=1810926 RepID=UPI003CCD409A
MSSYAQLVQDPDAEPDLETTTPSNNETSNLRIYTLAAVVCSGGLLFGYDSGVIGGVLTFPSFHASFNITPSTSTSVTSLAVGVQQAGALAGCLLIGPVTNKYGRKKALMLCSLIFCIGVIFEILNLHSLPIFYIGRVICGLAIGGSATVAPIYLAEMSPSHLRGRMGSGYQFTFTIGIFVSYWLDYALQFMPQSASQWQIPLALQLLPGAAMGIGLLFLPESVRWLLDRGETRDAWKSLLWVRGPHQTSLPTSGSSSVAAEFAEMKSAVESDRSETADFHPRELLQRPNLRRVLLAVGIFISQQATGATAMAYFGPQFFEILVGEPESSSSSSTAGTESVSGSLPLLLTGIFGVLKVTSCLIFILFIADRFGRKPLLTLGAAGMSFCLLATSILLSSTPDPSTLIKTLTVMLIYTTILTYNLSWGPLPWPLVAEIFPTRLRSRGVSLAVAAQWASNFLWSVATPYILRDLESGTFALFGVLDLGILLWVRAYLPETGGLTLEDVQGVFGDRIEGGIERERHVGGEDGECGDGENGEGDGDEGGKIGTVRQ